MSATKQIIIYLEEYIASWATFHLQTLLNAYPTLCPNQYPYHWFSSLLHCVGQEHVLSNFHFATKSLRSNASYWAVESDLGVIVFTGKPCFEHSQTSISPGNLLTGISITFSGTSWLRLHRLSLSRAYRALEALDLATAFTFTLCFTTRGFPIAIEYDSMVKGAQPAGEISGNADKGVD